MMAQPCLFWIDSDSPPKKTMSSTILSEFAGLSTAFLWALAAMCWAALSRRIRPTAVATMRLILAAIALTVIHFALYGHPWPTDISSKAIGMLCLSGVVAAGIGDVLYFHSIQRIGPRLTLTVTTLAPVVAALMALLLPMNEHMSWQEVCGMVLAVSGVAWVVAEKSGRQAWPTSPDLFRQGVVLAVLSVFCQAIGFVSSRVGMNAFTSTPVPAFSATLIRVTAGGLWCCGLVTVTRQARETATAFRDRTCLAWLLLGVAAGPVIGIWLSMIALQGAATGVASTLISLSPLFLIPMSWIAYGERPTIGRTVATIVAMGGIACMMLG